MAHRIFWAIFFAIVIVLVLLVIGLDCLQGSASLRILGVLQCNYGLTSSDLRIRAGAATAFVLFLALVFGPIGAALIRRTS